MTPSVFSFVRERSISYVIGQSSLGSCRHSRYPLAPRLARRAYRRRTDPYPPGDRGHCPLVQPLCGKARSIVRSFTPLPSESVGW